MRRYGFTATTREGSLPSRGTTMWSEFSVIGRLPTSTISVLLGLPADDLEWLIEVEERFQRRVIGQVTPPKEAAEASRELCDYFSMHIEDRRRRPREGLLSTIANATMNGE